MPPPLPSRSARTSPCHPRPRRWQEKSLPDPLARLAEAERAALALLRRRGFEVVPQPDGHFKVERQVLSAAEMIAKAHRLRAHAASLRAGQDAAACSATIILAAGDKHPGRWGGS